MFHFILLHFHCKCSVVVFSVSWSGAKGFCSSTCVWQMSLICGWPSAGRGQGQRTRGEGHRGRGHFKTHHHRYNTLQVANKHTGNFNHGKWYFLLKTWFYLLKILLKMIVVVKHWNPMLKLKSLILRLWFHRLSVPLFKDIELFNEIVAVLQNKVFRSEVLCFTCISDV